MFIEQIKSNVLSVMTQSPHNPKNLSRRVFIMAGEIIDRETYGGLRLSKVVKNCLSLCRSSAIAL